MKKKLKKIATSLWRFLTLLTGDNVSIFAAQASFFIIISAIPFLMFIFTLIKLFIDVDKYYILRTISAFAPAEISRFTTTILNELFDRTSSVSIISITAASTLWLSSKGFMGLYMGLNSVNNLPQGNYFYRRLISVIYTLAFIATLVPTILFFGFGNKLEQFLESRSTLLSHVMQLLLSGKIMIFLFYLTLIFAMFYRFLPKTDTKFRDHLPGAFIAAVGWLGFSYIYSVYIENISNYTYVYGSLAALVFLMLWLYFCMNIFLYGAQINKMIKNGFLKK